MEDIEVYLRSIVIQKWSNKLIFMTTLNGFVMMIENNLLEKVIYEIIENFVSTNIRRMVVYK